ncbi:MAG TPA: phosphate ABC transporter permease PstA, partial [Vicinamibacteria bacterium]
MSLRRRLARGDHMIWFTGSALGICLLMIFGLLAVILVNGLGIFWPSRLERMRKTDGSVIAGEIVQRQAIPNPGQPDHLQKHRIQVRVGNRDLYGFDFTWVEESVVEERDEPPSLFFVERSEYGPLIGTPVRVLDGDAIVAADPERAREILPDLLETASRNREGIEEIESDQIGEVNYEIEQLRLEARRLDFRESREPGIDLTAERAAIGEREQSLQARYGELADRLSALLESAGSTRVVFETVDGQEKEIRSFDIYRAYPANEISLPERAGIYGSRLWRFLSDEPREANTEGGIWPAIFGTVMMVFLMSLAVVPLGVLAALYLREYARQGLLVRTVRVAVNNLAGVPSIVFGVFGLGFFVYFVGGAIDRTFFPELLPTPTYGTGGILWASLTLALLTVPVVIVASEEAFAAVPRSMREASLAMGATQFQTIIRVVLPAAAPGILTGLILAMARAAGEVAPLMLTGVVKLAPQLPLDSFAPFFHLDRKFMHLGFHIYDVGFQ